MVEDVSERLWSLFTVDKNGTQTHCVYKIYAMVATVQNYAESTVPELHCFEK